MRLLEELAQRIPEQSDLLHHQDKGYIFRGNFYLCLFAERILLHLQLQFLLGEDLHQYL